MRRRRQHARKQRAHVRGRRELVEELGSNARASPSRRPLRPPLRRRALRVDPPRRAVLGDAQRPAARRRRAAVGAGLADELDRRLADEHDARGAARDGRKEALVEHAAAARVRLLG